MTAVIFVTTKECAGFQVTLNSLKAQPYWGVNTKHPQPLVCTGALPHLFRVGWSENCLLPPGWQRLLGGMGSPHLQAQ